MGFFSWVMSVSTTDYWNGFVDALVLTGHDVRALFNVLAERMKMEATDASNEGVDGLAEDPSGEGAVSHTDEGTVSRMKEATESVDVLEPVPEGGTQHPNSQPPNSQHSNSQQYTNYVIVEPTSKFLLSTPTFRVKQPHLRV